MADNPKKSTEFRGIFFLPFAVEISRASSRAERLLWVVLVLLCVSGFSYCLYVLLGHYLKHPTANRSDRIDLEQMELPEVSVCDANFPLNITKLRADNFSVKEISELHKIFTLPNYLAFGRRPRVPHNYSGLENIQHKFKKFSWEEFFGLYGPNCAQFFVNCLFDGMRRNCCEMAEFVVHPEHNVGCFKFRRLVQRVPDLGNGLVLAIAQRKPDDVSDIDYLSLVKGVYLTLSNTNHHHQQWFVDDMIPAHSNMETNVKIEMNEYRRLSRAERPCVSEQETTKCALQFYRLVESICNCSIPGTGTSSLSGCLLKELLQCSLSWRQIQMPMPKCTIPCKSRVFSSSIRDAQLVPQRIGRSLAHSLTEIQEHDYYLIRVFFQDFSYLVISEQHLVTFPTVMSGIGGLMSLYLGMNIVNISRFIAFSIRACIDHAENKAKEVSSKRMGKDSERSTNGEEEMTLTNGLEKTVHMSRFLTDCEEPYDM